MEKDKQRQFGVMLSYVIIVINFILGISYTPFMIKCLGQSQYGNYHYVSSVVGYLSLLTCGFGGAYLRFSRPYKKANDSEGVASINGLFLTLFLIMGVIALICGGVLYWKSDFIFGGKLTLDELELSKKLVIVLVINLFMTFPVSVFNSYVIAQEQFLFQKCVALVRAIASPMLSVIILLMGYKAMGVAVVVLIVTTVHDVAIIMYCFVKLKMKIIFKFNTFKQAKEVFIFSSFLLLSMIVDQINWSVDKFVLGKMMGTTVVAIYTVGANINTYYKTIGESISNVFVPKVYDLLLEPDGDYKASLLMTKLGRIQMMILGGILSGFILYGKTFVCLWVGKEYIQAYYVILLLMVPVTIPQIQKIGLDIQQAKNKHKFRSFVYTGIAVINIFISLPLSYKYGAIGAAMGTAITVLIGNGIIMNIYYEKVIKMDMKMFWREISGLIPAIVVSAVIGGFLEKIFHPQNWIMFISMGMVYVLLYISIVYFMAANNSEKIYFRKILTKVMRRK